jgi:hypothetical protein
MLYRFVCEYTGEIIASEEAERRGVIYDAQGFSTLFDLDVAGDCHTAPARNTCARARQGASLAPVPRGERRRRCGSCCPDPPPPLRRRRGRQRVHDRRQRLVRRRALPQPLLRAEPAAALGLGGPPVTIAAADRFLRRPEDRGVRGAHLRLQVRQGRAGGPQDRVPVRRAALPSLAALNRPLSRHVKPAPRAFRLAPIPAARHAAEEGCGGWPATSRSSASPVVRRPTAVPGSGYRISLERRGSCARHIIHHFIIP